MSIKISVDSTCDMPQALIEKHNIGITPLTLTVGGTEYIDGVDLGSKELFDRMSDPGVTCSTTAVNVSSYEKAFSEYLEEATDVIQFHISSDMSSCYQNALAASDGGHIFPIDSKNLSSGIALLALDAAELAEKGLPAEEISRTVSEKRELLDVSFVIDTLEYLRRGGRCSSVAALGANLLSLHPSIVVSDGKMLVGKKYRGNVEKCISKYIDDKLRNQHNIDYRRIFITYSQGFSDDFIKKVREQVASCGPFEEIIECVAGGTISCHCGPKTLGVLFYRVK